jgi:transcriptional regulator with XRE-family HTH domain
MMTGDELRKLRTQAGLTQAELAKLLKMTATFVGLMERGEADVAHRTEVVIDAMLRERIDVSYSEAVHGWIVAVTRPGKPPASREHHLLAVKPTKEAATKRAAKEQERNPLAMIIVRDHRRSDHSEATDVSARLR